MVSKWEPAAMVVKTVRAAISAGRTLFGKTIRTPAGKPRLELSHSCTPR